MPGKPIGCLDCGDDAWGNWRLDGPSIARYFRGSPQVHIWVHGGERPFRDPER